MTPNHVSPGARESHGLEGAGSKAFTVYRFYDAEGVLLYVGQTYRVENRLSKHRKVKSWWPEVARIELDHYATPQEMDRAETEAIRALKPLHNIRHRGDEKANAPATVSLVVICKEHRVEPQEVFKWLGAGCPVEILYGEPRFRAAWVRRWRREALRSDELEQRRNLREIYEKTWGANTTGLPGPREAA